ncbi:hypothetical protein Q4520_10800 [Alteromonas sp. 1_MG-2023]|uniref:hypothetical protein n=1 Tax=Alteromonas sp. 1_MG-2023 TaxID=3062669 RepID=UPI0026E418AD|nr:hypothetical protein [Alteromonas sp. 1_MG-2023]MDO6475917.1 hypothetical protein [Alteromonas sp. 1_MG-2023]
MGPAAASLLLTVCNGFFLLRLRARLSASFPSKGLTPDFIDAGGLSLEKIISSPTYLFIEINLLRDSQRHPEYGEV